MRKTLIATLLLLIATFWITFATSASNTGWVYSKACPVLIPDLYIPITWTTQENYDNLLNQKVFITALLPKLQKIGRCKVVYTKLSKEWIAYRNIPERKYETYRDILIQEAQDRLTKLEKNLLQLKNIYLGCHKSWIWTCYHPYYDWKQAEILVQNEKDLISRLRST